MHSLNRVSDRGLFIAGYFINSLSGWAFKFIVPLVVYAETHSLPWMTLVYGVLFAPNIFSPVLVNLIEGCFTRKTLLVIIKLTELMLFSACIFIFSSNCAVSWFLLPAFLLSSLLIFFQVLMHASVKDLFSGDRAVESVSRKIAFIDTLFPALGPLIGAAGMAYLRYDYLFMFFSMMSLASMLLLSLTTFNAHLTVSGEGFIGKTKKGFALIISTPFMFFMMRRFFLSNIAMHGFQATLTFYLIARYKLNSMQLGYFFAFSALGLILGTMTGRIIYAFQLNKWNTLALTGIVTSVCLIIIPLASSVYVAAFCWCIVMLLSSVNLLIFYAERQTGFDRENTLNAIAASYVILYSAIPLGALVSFLLSMFLDAPGGMMLMGIYLFIISLYFCYLAVSAQRTSE